MFQIKNTVNFLGSRQMKKIVRLCWWCSFCLQHGNRRNAIHGVNNGDWALQSGQLHRLLRSNNVSSPTATSLGIKLLLCCTRWFRRKVKKFLEVIVSVIVRKNVHMNMCLFLNGTEIKLFQFTNKRAMWNEQRNRNCLLLILFQF
jgi:hypothetical protein